MIKVITVGPFTEERDGRCLLVIHSILWVYAASNDIVLKSFSSEMVCLRFCSKITYADKESRRGLSKQDLKNKSFWAEIGLVYQALGQYFPTQKMLGKPCQ